MTPPSGPGVLWDPRVQAFRATAMRYADLAPRAAVAGLLCGAPFQVMVDDSCSTPAEISLRLPANALSALAKVLGAFV